MEINRVLVAGEYEEAFNAYLPDHVKPEFRFKKEKEITTRDLAWADAYVGFNPCPEFQVSNLKWVHSFNAGVNNYLAIDGWEENGVLLTRTVCSFGQKMSEYCLSYVLKDLQRHNQFQQDQSEKKWEQKVPKAMKDQTIVLFGTGEIGQEVAKMFHLFGAMVYGVSNSGMQKDYFTKVVDTRSAAEVLRGADWVISTLPLTSATKNLFNEEMFGHMEGAVFINVGRGATVDEAALLEALDAKRLRYAILDVFSEEPLPTASPLWTREDIVITPHISALTELGEAIECFVDTLMKLQKKEPLTNRVDFSRGY